MKRGGGTDGTADPLGTAGRSGRSGTVGKDADGPESFRIVGRVLVDPPLRAEEFEYLAAFTESRRWCRFDGPYAVPGNPLAECLDPGLDLARYVEPAPGQPGLWCPWRLSDGGHALVPVFEPALGEGSPPEEAASWLTYLCDHFLRTGAMAGRHSGDRARWFGGFGFDHVLDGAAVVCSELSGRLTLIEMSANSVSVQPLAS
ncbi:hypothetical protein SAMN05421678_107179 [Actinopolymorpha cephalotaxi]|uniref:Uncharacterized protein n=1 Tax=Actinopolymorpha cephalotaxi TaxID=504797 RepID=A0A1I2TG41_9ACTN|nr:hypothetical protein [Actinopolymorpha cephalotaxi]NYH83073.1 hypothetical protein [Actinopolymorpha cephalotaxi]SFG63878.1 hypothetical protein SAMN05421678_107179 [Actinopolymorpha cephalotaxi]